MRASKCGWRILNTFAPVCAVLTTLTKAYTWSRAACSNIQVNINIISTHKTDPLVCFLFTVQLYMKCLKSLDL